jgi:hypothetical protein
MAKTLASQARNGGSIPLARLLAPECATSFRTAPAPDSGTDGAVRYQACPQPQCGHSTDVLTCAVKT